MIRRALVLINIARKKVDIMEHRAMHNRYANKLQAVYRWHQIRVTTKLMLVVCIMVEMRESAESGAWLQQ